MDINEKEIYERLTTAESLLSTLHKRVDRQEELIENIRGIVEELKFMREDINKIDGKVTELEAKPVRRWEAVTAAIAGAVAGGLGTALITMILGG
ncbi:MAG: hypothetical protein K5876_00880 [Ruminiclostridium sp.]|nr:hypothetical protein [Ruminiclostridium sp.]